MLARILALFWGSLFLVSCGGPKEVDWVSTSSPQETRMLKVSYLEAWGYGPHRVLFRDEQNQLATKELKNDGKNLAAHNISLEWISEESVRVTLKGEEQKDETFVLRPAKIQP